MHTAAFSGKVEAIRALAEMKGYLQAQDVRRGGDWVYSALHHDSLFQLI